MIIIHGNPVQPTVSEGMTADFGHFGRNQDHTYCFNTLYPQPGHSIPPKLDRIFGPSQALAGHRCIAVKVAADAGIWDCRAAGVSRLPGVSEMGISPNYMEISGNSNGESDDKLINHRILSGTFAAQKMGSSLVSRYQFL